MTTQKRNHVRHLCPPASACATAVWPAHSGTAKGSNGLATAGFVLGLLGLLGSWIPVLNILGIILGVLGSSSPPWASPSRRR